MGPGFILAKDRKIVSKIVFPSYKWPDIRPFFERNRSTQGVFDPLTGSNQGHFDYSQTYTALERNHEPAALEFAAAIYRRTQVCMLDGINRLNLVAGRSGTPLNLPPQNHIQALFVDNARREKLKRATKDALGFYVLVDPTTPGQFRFCTSVELPDDPDIERSLTDRALKFFSKSQSIDSASERPPS
jgi:hypothetical protein